MGKIPQINECKIKLMKKENENFEWRAVFKVDGLERYLTIPIFIKEDGWFSGELQYRTDKNTWKRLDITTHLNFKDHLMIQIIKSIKENTKHKLQIQGITKVKFTTSGYEKTKYEKFKVEMFEK